MMVLWANNDIKPFDADPWAQQLALQLEKHFEQCEPPTKDKVVQVDVSDQANPKIISISESLSLDESQSLISLIWEYIDVFAWSDEDYLVLTHSGNASSQHQTRG